ncbi:hypothetical protein [Streptomyces sp. YIM S03343]
MDLIGGDSHEAAADHALTVHGISDAMVVYAPTFDQVLRELLRLTDARTVPAYNHHHHG